MLFFSFAFFLPSRAQMTQILALLLVTQVPEHLLVVFFSIHFISLSVFSSVSQFSCSVVSDSLRPPWTAALQASLSITNSRSLLKLMSIESVMPSSHLILFCPLLLLPSVFPSIRVFSSESVLRIRWPKYWSFSFSISPCNEYSGLISFRINRFYHLAIQGTLKSLLQHHSFKASALSLLLIQLSHPYMTTGNTIALTVLYCFLI